MSAAVFLRLLPSAPKTTNSDHHHHRKILLPSLPPLTTKPRPSSSPIKTKISASYSTAPATDRLVSAASYVLPFFNGLQYGRFAFMQYPKLELLIEPLLPAMAAYRAVPFAGFIAFFGLYLAVVRNPSFSRYVRFNAMQAIIMDVLLALPLMVQRIFNPGRGIGMKILIGCYNLLFLVVVGSFVYSFVSCVLGKTPYLPVVADAANHQLE